MARTALQRFTNAPQTQRLELAGALASLVLNTAGCQFDTTPAIGTSRPLTANTGTAYWSPPANKGQIVGTVRRSDAGVDKADSPNVDAAAGEQGSEMADAARPTPSTGKTETKGQAAAGRSGQSGAGAAGSANAAGAPANEPDAGSSICIAGHYDGSFEGTVTFLQGSVSGIKGTIRAAMTFDPMKRDFLRAREGTVAGVNDQGQMMNAGWTGALNCETGQLEDAKLINGTWDNGSRFSGTLTGAYSKSTSALSGMWQVQSDGLAWAGGNGNWSMRASPTP